MRSKDFYVKTDNVSFVWDAEKNRQNLKKHGIDFQLAKYVFFDPFRVEIIDDRYLSSEERFQALGIPRVQKDVHVCAIGRAGALLCVAYVMRKINGEDVVRLISARKATKTEAKQYNSYYMGEDDMFVKDPTKEYALTADGRWALVEEPNLPGQVYATLTKDSKMTAEQIEMLRALKDRPIVYDEDCPELTPEQLARFRRVNP